MAEITKVALKVDNNNSFPNNNAGAITPAILRAFNTNMIDSMVDEIPFGAYTQSVNTSLNALNVFTASATGLTTGSLLTTASAAGNVITFTKGNNTTFNVTVATGSSVDISSLNQATASLQAFTASAQISINNLNTTTASLNTSVSNINTFTASTAISLTNLNQSSASQQISIDSLNSKTGSYATTGSNTFTSANTFTSISASSFISASEFIGNGAKITGITASISMPILDEGIPQGNAVSLNFTGSAISAIVAGGVAIISVNGLDTGSYNALTQSFNSYTASTNADLNAIHQATASLQQFTASFSTSSLVSTSSFNAYTASNNQRVSSLETNSASVNTSISALNTFTASQSTASLVTSITNLNSFTSSQLTINTAIGASTSSLNTATASLFTSTSLSLTTASFSGNTLTFTKGNGTTFGVVIPDVSGSTINTGSFATTGSNSFNGNQIITGSVTISGSSTTDLTVVGQIFVSSSATGLTTAPKITVSGSEGTTTINRSSITTRDITYTSGLLSAGLFTSTISTSDEIGFAIDPAFYANWTTGPAIYVNNDALDTYPAVFGFQNKANYTDGRVAVLTPLSASAGFTASLQNGYAWIGNSLGQNTQVATSSISVATASVAMAVSTSISTQNLQHFVTFVDNSTGTQAIYVDGGLKYNPNQDLLLVNNITSSGYISGSSLNLTGTLTASLANGYVLVGNGSNITTLVATSSFSTIIPAGTLSSSAQILNYGIFATTGSNSFIGNQTITGSLTLSSSAAIELTVIGNMVVTGSAFGNVVSMSITSNTASMDLNLGNYFTLTLANTATTHISASNVQPGVSATLVITTGTNSSASLAPTMLQPSGSSYSATNGSGKKDVLSIVAVSSGVPFVVSTKNMI
jgi:hypothetical protein